MKKILTLFFALAFLLGCHDVKKPKEPENLLSKDQMVDILFDLAIVNSAKGVNKKMLEDNGVIPSQYIYKKHEIDSLQFVENNNYYAYRIDEYEEIIAKVMDSMQSIKEQLSKDMKEEEERFRTPNDSIKSIKKDRLAKTDSLDQKQGLNQNDQDKVLKAVDSLVVD